MIIHSIELESFGRFSENTRVLFDDLRVNVLAGPNGAGKSTLLDGLVRAFVHSYRSGAGEVAQVQPWGRQLAPRVAVEFSHGGERYRLEKKFLLKGRGAWLWQWRGGEYAQVAQDEAAEMRLPEFLGGAATAGRSAASKQLLMASVLWTQQNGLTLGAVDGTVLERVRQSLGAQAESGVAAFVEREAARRYAEDWQPQGRAWKKGAAAAAAQERMEEARAECGRWETALRELDSLREEVLSLERSAVAAREMVAGLEPELEVREKRLAEWREKSSQKEKVRLEWSAKQSEYQLEKSRREQRSGLTAQVAELEGLLEKGEAEVEAARGQLAAAEGAVYRRLMEARAADADLREREAALNGLAAPAAELISRIERLEMQLDASLIHLDFEAYSGVSIQILSGEPGGVLELRGGEGQRVSGSPEIQVELPGFGRIRASGPPSSAADLRLKLAAARRQLREADAGEAVGALRARREAADGMEREVESLRVRVRELKGEQGWADLDALQLAHPEWSAAALPAAGGGLTLAAARATLVGLERAQMERQSGLEKARRGLAELPAERAPGELDALALEVHGLREKLNAIEGQLREYPPDLEQQAAGLRQQVDGAKRRLKESEANGREKRAVLRDRLGDAPYEAYARAKGRLAECEEAARAAAVRANAGKLLLETLKGVKTEMTEQFVEPVAAAANGMLARIAGQAPGVVRLSGDLVPTGVLASGVEVALEQLSGGEFEQVHFATRLALADVLAAGERQLVVFDDVLMATDAHRMSRVLDLLEERRERLQILLLTCHPERYEELRERNLIDLTRIGEATA